MTSDIDPPSARVCTRCGREDRWDDDLENWVIEIEDGRRLTGRSHCVHEWDINGSYNPVDTG